MHRQLTLQQFNQLAYPEKRAVMKDQGIYLEVYRVVEGLKARLFALHGYYVEMYYTDRSSVLIKASAFDDYKRLDLYLDQIPIPFYFQ